jgi:hypothetical protein
MSVVDPLRGSLRNTWTTKGWPAAALALVSTALLNPMTPELLAAFARTRSDEVAPFKRIPGLPAAVGTARRSLLIAELAIFIDQSLADGTLQLPEDVTRRLVDNTKTDARRSRAEKIEFIIENMY